MKTAILCWFFLASLLIVRGDDEKAVDAHDCGEKTCSPAQICVNNECACTQIRCMILCPDGFKVDENGCEYPCTCA
nr:guamerin [Whitmania pigra]